MSVPPAESTPPLDVLRQIDQLCLRFEAAWRSANPPRIEDYLVGLPEPARVRLFRELLLTEAELRGRGAGVDADTYRERFPEYTAVIEEALRESAEEGEPALGTAPPGYEVVRELGRGGMGVVYLARHTQLGRLVALKIIRDSGAASSEGRRRFLAEAALAARLAHPNVVQIHEAGEHAGCPFMALEYVAGGSLAAQLAGKPQPPEEAAALVEVLARAMQAAHDAGVVHRDLKPANVLLSRRAGVAICPAPGEGDRRGRLSYEVKVTDFGLARDLSAEASRYTRTGQVMGTPSYMAPEQAEGKKDIGPAADIYALGAILYECLTGRPPFRGAAVPETLEHVRTHEPAPPHLLRPGLPGDLETICLKCLQKAPAARYPSALALADDLRAFLERRPIQARRVGAGGTSRRRLGVVMWMAAVILLCLGAFGVAGWKWWQAEQGRANAEDTARRVQRRAARLAVEQGQLLCEQGQVGRGLVWLAHGLSLAHAAGADGLEHAARINLAAWMDHLDVPGRPDRIRIESPLAHPQPVSSLAWVEGGRRLLTVCDDGCRLWELSGAAKMVGPWRPAGHKVRSAAASPDGRYLAVACRDTRMVRLIDPKTGDDLGIELSHERAVGEVVFSPSSRHLLVLYAEEHDQPDGLTWWELSDGRPIRSQRGNLPGKVRCVAFHPDGTRLLYGRADGQAHFWDVEGQRVVGPPLAHAAAVTAVAFSRDGTRALTGCADGTVRMWKVPEGEPLGVGFAQQASVSAVAFSPESAVVLSASADGTARFWDALTGLTLGPPLRHEGPVSAAIYHPLGEFVVTAGKKPRVQRWRVPPSPWQGTPEEATLTVEVRTGLTLDENGAIRPLDETERRQRKEHLRGTP